MCDRDNGKQESLHLNPEESKNQIVIRDRTNLLAGSSISSLTGWMKYALSVSKAALTPETA